MKLATLALTCFLVILAFMGCGKTDERHVLAIVRTEIYHTPACGKVSMAHAVEMTIDEAKSKRLHPCPNCRPDQGL